MKKYILYVTLFIISVDVITQSTLEYNPKILLVTAHPDDDALVSATVWKTTQLLRRASRSCITNKWRRWI